MKNICISTASLNLEFSHQTGALVYMEAPKTGWIIQRRPELGMSWRMLVPVHEELRNNPVMGVDQTLSRYELTENGVRFYWDEVVSKRAGVLPISVTVEVAVEGTQVVWRTHIDNHSPYIVESVYSPYIGDLNKSPDSEKFDMFFMDYSDGMYHSIYPEFKADHGDWATDTPIKINDRNITPYNPFILLCSPNQGLYVGVKDDSAELVSWYWQLHPGFKNTTSTKTPLTDELNGKTVYIEFAPVHMCYLPAGESVDLTPIMMEAYEGDWRAGVDIYREWADTWMTMAKRPAWIEDPHSWLQIHINSPEDELRMRFTDLPKVAAECAKYGIKAIQLVGWNKGGQDQGNPSHDPDPRLGTFEELKAAIKECQSYGVKMILFAKFTWADRAEKWFREELVKYAIKNPYGDYYVHPGYRYQTPAQFLGINTKHLVPMCFGSDAYIEICKKEFQKLLDLGCDGFLYDEAQHHHPTTLCFDTSHGHKYGWPTYKNDRKFIQALKSMPGVPEDFLFAAEACHDWLLSEYQLAYIRSKSEHHFPAQMYLRPQIRTMTAVQGFEDRNLINQCLMYRYIISYEPYSFKGVPSDYPETVAYGNKMDQLRTRYRKYLWDARHMGQYTGGVKTLTGEDHPQNAYYVTPEGEYALVITNYEETPITLTIDCERYPFTKYRTVDEDVWYPVAEETVIPPCSAVVVL